MQAMWGQFKAWQEKYQDNLVDMGGKLGTGKVVTADGVSDVTSADSSAVVGGYMIVSAATLEQAIEVALGCPGLVSPGSGVEVREIQTS